MRILKFKKIIGVILIILLFIQQVPVTNAIYSPILSKEAARIKSDIASARQVTGVGTLANVYERIKQAATRPNEGLLRHFGDALLGLIQQSIVDSYADDFSLLIGHWIENKKLINNCLRDDIWEMNALKEEVLNELFKSAVLSNIENSNRLWNDYLKINEYIKGHKSDGTPAGNPSLRNEYEDSYWFPGGGQNYYIDCPYGEFLEAWKELVETLENFENMGQEGLMIGSFSSMFAAAEKRGIQKAAKYIAANKITFTLGGEVGASPRSLLNGPGLDGLLADLSTELGFVADLGEAVFVDTFSQFADDWADSEDVGKIVAAYEQAQEAKANKIAELGTELKFNLSLNNVSENSLIDIERVMFEINEEIKKSFETDTSLKRLCEVMQTIPKQQCKNKTGGLGNLSCK